MYFFNVLKDLVLNQEAVVDDFVSIQRRVPKLKIGIKTLYNLQKIQFPEFT